MTWSLRKKNISCVIIIAGDTPSRRILKENAVPSIKPKEMTDRSRRAEQRDEMKEKMRDEAFLTVSHEVEVVCEEPELLVALIQELLLFGGEFRILQLYRKI